MKRLEFPKSPRLIDVNVHLSRWPFRRLPHDEPQRLVEKMREQNVTCAMTSSFDAILHRDLSAVNARLVDDCEKYGKGLLTPVGAVNLSLPGWESDLEYCVRTPEIVGVRLYPGTHDSLLEGEQFAALCEQCAEQHLILQIVIRLEDPRTEHPQFPSKTVDLRAALEIFDRLPQLQIMLLNPGRDILPAMAGQLVKKGNVHLDLGMMEQTGGVSKYLQHVPPERLLFGSHFPFFYFEAASLKLHENEMQAGQHVIDLIAFQNAERLLARKK